MTKFSVSIIAKNREVELAKCLRSVKGADEIVVLDTGSVDKTPQIAIEHGARLYYYRWEDDFAAARNRCLDYVSNSWVLSIDSDEVLQSGIKSVYDTINKNFSKHVIGVRINQPNGTSFYGSRLYRRESTHWKREIHEELSRQADLVTDDVIIQHKPSKDHASSPERNIAILRRCLDRDPLSAIDAYYLGEELYSIGQYDSALYWLRLFVELQPYMQNLTAEAYYMISDCYCNLRRVGKGIDALIASVKVNPEMRASYERLYQLTKNDSWKQKAYKATNKNVAKIR